MQKPKFIGEDPWLLVVILAIVTAYCFSRLDAGTQPVYATTEAHGN